MNGKMVYPSNQAKEKWISYNSKGIISKETDVRQKIVTREKEGHFVTIKRSIH